MGAGVRAWRWRIPCWAETGQGIGPQRHGGLELLAIWLVPVQWIGQVFVRGGEGFAPRQPHGKQPLLD